MLESYLRGLSKVYNMLNETEKVKEIQKEIEGTLKDDRYDNVAFISGEVEAIIETLKQIRGVK